MSFRGVREYRTQESLAADLRRQNQAIEDGFAEGERLFARRPRTVRVTDAIYQAEHGDLVEAGFNQDATIILPVSTPETAGLTVDIARVANTITIVAQSEQLVDGAASVTLSTTGRREFKDNGAGGFWGNV